MSQRQALINHCDVCGHEWMPTPGVVYTHCTSGKCRSRKWNTKGAVDQPDRALVRQATPETVRSVPEAVGSIPTEPIKPNMQALRDICVGRLPGDLPKGSTGYKLSLGDTPIVEVEFCGKTWWEDGEQYQCLMDKGHKALKCGQRGMVRNITA